MSMKDKVSRLLAAGALAASAAIPITVAQLALAPAAHADGCMGGGGGVPWYGNGGGHICGPTTTPGGNTVQCGNGSGFARGVAGGGGGCHVWGGPAGDFYCDISVHAPFVVLWNINPCPYID